MQSITVTTPGARVVLRAGRYLDSIHRVGTVVGLDANPHRPYPLAVNFDGDDRGTRCVYPGDLALVWSAPVVVEVEPEPVEAAAPVALAEGVARSTVRRLNKRVFWSRKAHRDGLVSLTPRCRATDDRGSSFLWDLGQIWLHACGKVVVEHRGVSSTWLARQCRNEAEARAVILANADRGDA